MKLLHLFSLSTCLVTFPAFAPLAQEQKGAEPADKVEIVTDEGAGAVRIVIDGREVATIDADGLHVTGDIEYTGAVRDTAGDAE